MPGTNSDCNYKPCDNQRQRGICQPLEIFHKTDWISGEVDSCVILNKYLGKETNETESNSDGNDGMSNVSLGQTRS